LADSRIREKILKDAEDDAEGIAGEAKEKTREILSRARAEETNIRKETKELCNDAKRRELERRLSEARMQNRAQTLGEKRKIIDSVFSEVKTRILSLKKDDYIRFISNMITEEVKSGKFTLVLSINDVKRLGGEIPKKILAELDYKGEAGTESENFDGGCIVKKDTYEFNATADTILVRIKEKMEGELAKILFY